MKLVRQVRLIGTVLPVKHVYRLIVLNLYGMRQKNNVYNALGTVIVPAQHPIVTQVPMFVKNVLPIRSAAQANIAKPMAVALLAAVQRLTGTQVPKSAKPARQTHLIGMVLPVKRVYQ